MQALKRKEVNLITASKRKDKQKEETKGSKAALVFLPVVLCLAVAGTIGYLYYQIVAYHALTAAEIEYLQSPQLAEQNAALQECESEIASLRKQKDIVDRTNQFLAGITELDREDIEAVLDSTNDEITITDISYSSGILTITAKGSVYTAPPLYVQRLEATDTFAYVDYIGFMEEVTDTESAYTFTVSAALKGAEVTENEQ